MSLYGNASATPELHSLQVTQSTPGIVIPILFGTNRLPQNLLWYGDFKSGQPYQQGGKGLGKNGQAYEYYAAVLGALCQGVLVNVLNVYSQNGRLNLNATTENYVVPPGGGSYTVANASRFATDAGAGAVTPYSVTANNYGAPAPVVMSGVYTVPHTAVPSSPGTNQYTQSAGTYTFPASSAGQNITISYTFSLYVLLSTEDYIVPNTSPYEVTVQYAPEFRTDEGVLNILTGVAFTIGSGPGQYTTDGAGNYFFDPADAGASIAISYTWRQSDSDIDPNSMLNFTLIEGEAFQAPWTFLTSNHLSQAFGYSTIAMIGAEAMDLGESATLPNYNFECQSALTFGAGILDAPVDQCILALLLDPHFGAGFQGAIDSSLSTIAADYWNSNSFFISPILNSSESCSSIIERWLEAGNTGVYWSEGLLKFVPYGDTTTIGNGYVYTPQTHPVVDLNDDDFLAPDNEDPVSIERTPFQDAYNSVKVQFQNRANAYNQDLVQETDDYAIALYGLRPEAQQDYDFVCTATAASFSANLRLKRLVYIRGKYHFTVSAIRYCYLEPMDLVTITDEDLGLSMTPVRITETEENDQYELDITAEEFPWGTSTSTLYPKQPTLPPPPPPSLAQPGDTNVASIFEPSSRVATTVANSAFQIWAALNGGPNWGGCNVWLSFDNQSFDPIGVQNGPSRCGVITADLPAGSDPDTTNTLKVSTSGQLFNVTPQQADALATLCKVGTEYLSYANATITGNNGLQTSFYDLDYLRRGAFTSPDILHLAADPNENQFIRLDSQIFQYSYDPSLAGKTVYLKFTSFNLLQNQEQDLSTVKSYPVVIGGINLSADMTVDSVLDSGGLTAKIRIYSTAGGVGTDGSATLTNGAVIALPADIQSGETLGTIYYVNFDPASNAYVFYTDQNSWLLDEINNGFIRIGQVLTPTDFSIIQIQGGGSVAIGTGTGAFGSSIPLPSGYLAANMAAWTTPHVGYDASNQIQGVLQSSAPGGVLSSQYKYRSIGGALNCSSNWIAVAWTAGAGVTISVVGGFTFISFTTAMGDDLCVVVGQAVTGAVPVPSGFSASEFISIIGMESTNPTGNGLQVVNNASLDPSLNITAIYSDGSGNQWGGSANVFGIFWKTGGGVTSTSVTGGTAIIVPLPGSAQLAFIQAVLANAASFGLPPGYGSGGLVTAAAMRSQDGPAGSAVAHGTINCECSGTTFTGLYEDGTAFVWGAFGSIFAIATP